MAGAEIVAGAEAVAGFDARTEAVAAPVGLAESLDGETGIVAATDDGAGKPAVAGPGETTSACEVTAKEDRVVSAKQKEKWAFIAKELTVQVSCQEEITALCSGANKRSF